MNMIEHKIIIVNLNFILCMNGYFICRKIDRYSSELDMIENYNLIRLMILNQTWLKIVIK